MRPGDEGWPTHIEQVRTEWAALDDAAQGLVSEQAAFDAITCPDLDPRQHAAIGRAIVKTCGFLDTSGENLAPPSVWADDPPLDDLDLPAMADRYRRSVGLA